MDTGGPGLQGPCRRLSLGSASDSLATRGCPGHPSDVHAPQAAAAFVARSAAPPILFADSGPASSGKLAAVVTPVTPRFRRVLEDPSAVSRAALRRART